MHRIGITICVLAITSFAAQWARAAAPAAVDAKGAAQVRDSLEGVVENALKPGELDDVVAGLVKAARQRMEKYADEKHPDLDAEIEQFVKAWRGKYKRDFAFSSEKNHEQILDYRLSPGADAKHATVTVPAGHGMPETTFAVVNESRDNWMIVVDDATTGEQLKDRLIRALKSLNARAADLPADATEGYRLVSHTVLAAVLGVGGK